MSADKLVALGTQRAAQTEWEPHDTPIEIGKDILELLSGSMYIEPISIFREYIQNAADSIDEARRTGLLQANEPGCVNIDVNTGTRTIKIRDNGLGLAHDEFAHRLTAFGASRKRIINARGSRGVGRLAGLGYCKELIFRSRVAGESRVNELQWDCRRLRTLLRDKAFEGNLGNLVKETVATRRIDGRGLPEHFFEVELVGVVRQRNDQLLNATAIGEYLSEVAPVPFAPEFRYGEEITAALSSQVDMGNIEIRINGAVDPIYRPHRNQLEIGGGKVDQFVELEAVQIPAVDGEIAAIGWVLHHGYTGALPVGIRVRGLRLRSGNIQIGGDDLLEELFPETRFNGWAVGEIHVLDRRLVPNGRRDHFEQNVHLLNLINYLSPIAREISRRCRTSSVRRKWLKDFDRYEALTNDKAAILRQRSLSGSNRARVAGEIEELLDSMARIAGLDHLDVDTKKDLSASVIRLRKSLSRLLRNAPKKTALDHLPAQKRRVYRDVIALIYELSPNKSAAKTLVDKILAKLK